VKFWDTSAVVPLLVAEPETARVRRLADDDPVIVTWWATRTECVSALARLRREHAISADAEIRTRRLLAELAAEWAEISAGTRVRDRAERLLSFHALRAGDAFQLAAALTWARGEPAGRAFVSFDDRLRSAAAREGFDILP